MPKNVKDASIKKMVSSVSDEQAFILKDGKSLNNIQQLYDALNSMDNDTFCHHVNDEKNDFGNWIKDVFKDYRLANSLFSSKNKSTCLKEVGNRIYELEKITACPSSIIMTPADNIQEQEKKQSTRKKISMDVDPAELEKTIQEITRRYWEKKKTKNANIEAEIDATLNNKPIPKKTVVKGTTGLRTSLADFTRKGLLTEKKKDPQIKKEIFPEKELKSSSVSKTSSVEDLLEIIEEEGNNTRMLDDFRLLFSTDTIKEAASDLKKLFISNKDEIIEMKEVLKSCSNNQNPNKENLLSQITDAHSKK